MHQRYVLASHTPEQFAATSAYVADHQPGDGLRAALPLEDAQAEFTHLYALQGLDLSAVDSHQSSLVAPTSTTMTFDPCKSVDCHRISDLFDRAVPITMPPYDFYALVIVELREQAVSTFVPPPLTSGAACLPTEGGRRLLVQLATDDGAALESDLAAFAAHSDVLSTRALRSSGRHLVRSSHV